MEYESGIATVLIILLLFFSLDFSKYYGSSIHNAARSPFVRFLAGLCIVLLANVHPTLAVLLFMIVFFWIADVHLLSTFSFTSNK